LTASAGRRPLGAERGCSPGLRSRGGG
jgi:hypothetical protein